MAEGRAVSGPRLSIIPARAATDPALKPRDLQVLCVLGRHTNELGWCTKSQVKMAAEIGCARSTVFDAVERLVKAGYLERHVQESTNGRDRPHLYRVILDPKHPDPSRIPADDCDAIDPCRQIGTPADIPAPPAGPEPAPPAGPEPAPKNDPIRTTYSERDERDRERGDDENGFREMGERDFRRAFSAWPTYLDDSEPKARAAWSRLTASERSEAVSRQADYCAAAGKVGGRKTLCSFGTYLGEKRWEKLPPPAVKVEAPSDYAPPFGPVWGAFVVARWLDEHEDRRKQVSTLYGLARLRKGYRFGERWHGLKGLMEAVPVGSSQFEAWREEFERRDWEWLPDPGDQRVVYFPACGPQGLEVFKAAINGQQAEAAE